MTKITSYLLKAMKYLTNPPILQVKDFKKGRNVTIEPDVEIRCDRLVLGDGVIIKSGTRIAMVDLVIGDYTKINNNCLLTGTDYCRIGHNCWFGHFTIIDSIGGTRIGNGVGVGAHSQLWTHAYFGDILEGCRFASHRPLIIEDDVWFVGHCIVSPIHAKRRSMAMVGSVVTKNMKENHVYAGVPAKDMTKQFGNQFQDIAYDKKNERLRVYLNEFLMKTHPKRNRIQVVDKLDMSKPHFSQFSLRERMYIKNLYPEEVKFMKFLLHSKAKFLPHPNTDWVAHYLTSIPNGGVKGDETST